MFSNEMENKQLTDEAYIEILYRGLMGRTYDKIGMAYWQDKMKNGMSREQVFDNFVVSKEFRNICKKYNIE